jgi:replication-associated recombination protein RarA
MSTTQNIFSPASIDDVVIGDPTSETALRRTLDGSMPFPLMKRAICLWGTYGTGKTTLAELLPGWMEVSGNLLPSSRPGSLFGGNYYKELTLCGLGANTVNLMSDIKSRMLADAAHSPSGWHYEILDEVDLLTPAAQASLKSLITHATSTIFIFTTNHLLKLDGGLVDRSLLIEMNQPKPEQLEAMGCRILRQMGLTGYEIDSKRMQAMAQACRGSLRDFGSAVIAIGTQHGGCV